MSYSYSPPALTDERAATVHRPTSAELPSVDCCNLIYNQPQPCSCESTVRRYFGTAVYLFIKLKYEKVFLFSLPCQSKVALLTQWRRRQLEMPAQNKSHCVAINALGFIKACIYLKITREIAKSISVYRI